MLLRTLCIPGAASLRRGFLLLWHSRGLLDKPVLKGGKVAKEKRYLRNPPLWMAPEGDQPPGMGWLSLSLSTLLWSVERKQGNRPGGTCFSPLERQLCIGAWQHRALRCPWAALAGFWLRGWQVSPARPLQPHRTASILAQVPLGGGQGTSPSLASSVPWPWCPSPGSHSTW